MADLGLSGLASGVDTNTIVDKLMAIERKSLSRVTLSKQRVQERQSDLKAIQAKLSALKSAAAELRAPALWRNVQSLTSSDGARVGVQRLTDSGTGSYGLEVQQLARGAQRTFTYTPDPNPGVVTVGGVDVPIAGGATLDQVAASINATADTGVIAASVAGQLVLSSRTTGAASAVAAGGSSLGEDPAKAVGGLDAEYTIDGQPKTSTANLVDDAIPGTRLVLKAITAAPVTVSLGEPAIDKEAVKSKLKTFVDAYNAVVSITRSNLAEKVEPKSVTVSGQTKGQLHNDPGLGAMLSGLRSAVSGLVGGNAGATDSLADLGISTGKPSGGVSTRESIEGKLVFDDSKLTALLDADPQAVKQLLGGAGVPGIAQRFEGLVDQQVGSSAMLDGRIKSGDDEIKRIDTRYADMDRRLGEREKRMRAQFAAMESALQATQTQQSWLSGQIAALNR